MGIHLERWNYDGFLKNEWYIYGCRKFRSLLLFLLNSHSIRYANIRRKYCACDETKPFECVWLPYKSLQTLRCIHNTQQRTHAFHTERIAQVVIGIGELATMAMHNRNDCLFFFACILYSLFSHSPDSMGVKRCPSSLNTHISPCINCLFFCMHFFFINRSSLYVV